MRILVLVCCYLASSVTQSSRLKLCETCADEANCSNLRSCRDPNGQCFELHHLCDGIPQCDNCNDEKCPNSTLFHCENGHQCVGFLYFCDGKENCDDDSDEKTTGFGFKCASELSSLRCVIPQQYLKRFVNSTEVKLCKNNVHQCFQIIDGKNYFDSSNCWSCLEGTIIQRQQVCDGIFDCPDLSDECLCKRKETENICKGIFDNPNCSLNEISCPEENLCLNVSQICGKKLNCSSGFYKNHCIKKPEACEKDYSCSDDKFLRLGSACDGFIECNEAEDECNDRCEGSPWYCNHTSSFNRKIEGDNCSIDYSKVCDKFSDCPNSTDEIHCPHLQRCNVSDPKSKFYNKRECGKDTDRCNLQATCENIADELNCSNTTHFYCDNNKKFLPLWRLFDEKYDCDDFSDECTFDESNISSPQQLVHSVTLRVFLWILMFFSLTGNAVVLIKTALELNHALRRRSRSSINRIDVCNKIMILNLSFSDILLGLYLLLIAVKTIEFSGVYCKIKFEWLQSAECSFLGVLAVISSQTSVFLMVLMTSYRLYGVIKPFRANKMRNKIIYVAVACIWFLSLIIALVPIIPSFKLFFDSRLYVNQPYGLGFFLSFTDLENFFKEANRLPGIRNSLPTPTNLTIQTFCNLFTHSASKPLYCNSNQQNTSNTIGYYGFEGVCLPRYYVSWSEPAAGFTLVVLGFNFAAFVYMLVAYLYVYHLTSADLQQTDPQVDEERMEENRALWSKIVRLIATNFLCWVPICIMSFISFSGVTLPPIVYPITAIILVPINSASNPWLYSSFLIDNFRMRWESLRHRKLPAKKQSGRRRKKTERRGSGPNPSIELFPVLPSSTANTTNEVTVATEL